MSVTYGFFNSVNHDRKYDASQFSRLFEGVFNDGVFASIGTGLVVVSNPLVPMGVNVGIGRAWFDLTWTDNDAILPLEVAAAHPILNRIDAVVIEVDFTEAVRANSIKIVTGTAASNPSNPAMSQAHPSAMKRCEADFHRLLSGPPGNVGAFQAREVQPNALKYPKEISTQPSGKNCFFH
jgi:hypothetical protein